MAHTEYRQQLEDQTKTGRAARRIVQAMARSEPALGSTGALPAGGSGGGGGGGGGDAATPAVAAWCRAASQTALGRKFTFERQVPMLRDPAGDHAPKPLSVANFAVRHHRRPERREAAHGAPLAEQLFEGLGGPGVRRLFGELLGLVEPPAQPPVRSVRSSGSASAPDGALGADAEAAERERGWRGLRLTMSATELGSGHYLGMHTDNVGDEADDGEWRRRLAVVLHLASPAWTPRCGGALVWCSPPTVLPHSFNAITIFPVSPLSHHMVAPVCADDDGDCLAATQAAGGSGGAAAGPVPVRPGCGQSQRRLAFAGWVVSRKAQARDEYAAGLLQTRRYAETAARLAAAGEPFAMQVDVHGLLP